MTKNSNNKTFLPGDFIFREGEFGKVAYVIEEGDIELVKFTGDEYITLAEITKGALFGEMAIIDGSPRSGSARAKTSCIFFALIRVIPVPDEFTLFAIEVSASITSIMIWSVFLSL